MTNIAAVAGNVWNYPPLRGHGVKLRDEIKGKRPFNRPDFSRGYASMTCEMSHHDYSLIGYSRTKIVHHAYFRCFVIPSRFAEMYLERQRERERERERERVRERERERALDRAAA